MQLRHTIYAAFVTTAFLVSAGADGTITEVKPGNSDLKLKVWTVQGNRYRLQSSTNLVDGSWANISEQFTAQLTKTNLTVGTEAKSCWFRVVEERVQIPGPRTPPTPPAAIPSQKPAR